MKTNFRSFPNLIFGDDIIKCILFLLIAEGVYLFEVQAIGNVPLAAVQQSGKITGTVVDAN